MIDLVAALVGLFLLDPLKAELADKLQAARAPQAVVSQIGACASAAARGAAERAVADPWWAASSAVGLWVGASRPEALLVEVAPGCAGAVTAARPFLAGREA